MQKTTDHVEILRWHVSVFFSVVRKPAHPLTDYKMRIPYRDAQKLVRAGFMSPYRDPYLYRHTVYQLTIKGAAIVAVLRSARQLTL